MLGNLNIGSLNGAGFMPINLVINPEFTVNQRGAASRTAATGYNYDRWYYDGSSLLQGIENLNLRNTTYVVSWSGSATCSYSLNTAASSSQGGQTYTSIANGGTLTISSLGSNNLWLKFSGTVSDLTNVMCVPSPAQTPFVPRQYQQELALCQRYYLTSANGTPVNYNGGWVGVPYTNSTEAFGSGPFKVTMRASPTVVLYDGAGASGKVTQVGQSNGITASVAYINEAGFSNVARASGTWASNNSYYPIAAGYTASAEL